MVQLYTGHEIIVVTREFTLDQWDLNIAIFWTEENHTLTHQLATMRGTFYTVKDAILFGLTLAKHWIDDGKPDRPLIQIDDGEQFSRDYF